MSKSLFIVYCIVLHCIAFFVNALGQLIAFPVEGLLFSFGGIYLLKNNPFVNKKIGYLFIFGLLPSLIFGAFIYSFNDPGFAAKPQAFVLLISIIFAFIFHKKSNPQLLKIGAVYILFLAISTALLPNYYIWRAENKSEYELVEKDFPDLKLFDEKGDPVDLKKPDNKIIVLDVWSTSCGICIKKFPDFERLKNEFSNDSSIAFYTLNLPVERSNDNKQDIEKYTNPYSFNKLYADKDVQKQLGIVGVPVYVILDKNKKVRYMGSLNTGTFEFHNNFYSIIDKIK